MRKTAFPLLLILFGVAWLASARGWFSDWTTVTALGLIIVGIAILATEGINRQSIVAGPMLIYCGGIWLAYIRNLVPADVLLPIGVVVWGVLLLIARIPTIPEGRRRRQTRAPESGRPPTLPL